MHASRESRAGCWRRVAPEQRVDQHIFRARSVRQPGVGSASGSRESRRSCAQRASMAPASRRVGTRFEPDALEPGADHARRCVACARRSVRASRCRRANGSASRARRAAARRAGRACAGSNASRVRSAAGIQTSLLAPLVPSDRNIPSGAASTRAKSPGHDREVVAVPAQKRRSDIAPSQPAVLTRRAATESSGQRSATKSCGRARSAARRALRALRGPASAGRCGSPRRS